MVSLKSTRLSSRMGFTIVELLVVMAVIGALVAILIPAVGSLREQGRRVSCMNNLRNQGLAIQQFLEGSQQMLPALWKTNRPYPWQNFSWRVELLPYLEQGPIHDRLDWATEPLATPNLAWAQYSISVFECPSVPLGTRKISTVGHEPLEYRDCLVGSNDYVAVYDVRIPARTYPLPGIWNGSPDLQMELETPDASMASGEPRSAANRNRASSTANARDGLSSTALIVEQAGRPQNFGTAAPDEHAPDEGPWATGDWSSFTAEGVNVDNRTNPYGFHRVANVVMADGSCHAWSSDISPDVLRALLTADGDEIIQPSDWQ